MIKEEFLQELSLKVATGEISREEIAARLEVSTGPQVSNILTTDLTAHMSLTKILYLLGASIVVLGVLFFGAQVWDDLGSFGRITVTLGLGLVFSGFGSWFLAAKPETWLGQVFHTIGGALIPGGAIVTLYELSHDINSPWPIAVTFGVIFIFYILLTLYHKNAILTFFSIGNGTAFIYLLVAAMLDNSY